MPYHSDPISRSGSKLSQMSATTIGFRCARCGQQRSFQPGDFRLMPPTTSIDVLAECIREAVCPFPRKDPRCLGRLITPDDYEVHDGEVGEI